MLKKTVEKNGSVNLTGFQKGLIMFDKRSYSKFIECHYDNQKKRCPNCSKLATKKKVLFIPVE